MLKIIVNTRVLTAPVTGVQRYTKALVQRWDENIEQICPGLALRGFAGHAWEQFVLPARLKRRLLFSPSNTGPLLASEQILTVHDMSTFDCPETFSSRFVAWYQFLLPRLTQRVRFIITVSEFIKGRILAHIPVKPEKVAVIPNGVDSRFRPEAISETDKAMASVKLPSSKYILTVGSLEPRKNLHRLLEAWARVQGRLPDELWLVVVGIEGNSRVFSGVRFDSLPAKCFFAGHVAEQLLPALYAGAVATVYVSIYEGFGLPLLEAMACGTPVLTGSEASMPELVGDAGMIVDPFSVDEIAKGICRLVENSTLRADLRQRGLLRARRFSWDETARKTWEILEGMAAD